MKWTGAQIVDFLYEVGLHSCIMSESFDWVFQYESVAGLDDYQRIVLRNFGGCEYVHWDVYRKYFHNFETELEYLDFWEELSKKLKWMEGYLPLISETFTWERIHNRGSSQAIKIAAGFSKITATVAQAAFLEYVDGMGIDIYLYRDLHGVYFEVWKRVVKLRMSFKDALDEVYRLNKFPLRQNRMKYELEFDGSSQMENEFDHFTAGITEQVTEEKAQELIADAATNMQDRPKYYVQYIKRKIDIARAIGVIPTASP